MWRWDGCTATHLPREGLADAAALPCGAPGLAGGAPRLSRGPGLPAAPSPGKFERRHVQSHRSPLLQGENITERDRHFFYACGRNASRCSCQPFGSAVIDMAAG